MSQQSKLGRHEQTKTNKEQIKENDRLEIIEISLGLLKVKLSDSIDWSFKLLLCWNICHTGAVENEVSWKGIYIFLQLDWNGISMQVRFKKGAT